MPAPKITSVQVRRGTKVEWDAANPQLLDGEIGFETDTYRLKIGRRNNLGRLIHWNDLRYQAPFSGLEKPNFPQDGDFWVEDSTKDLYFFDGAVWRRILATNENGDIIINGSLNMENGCVTGDLLPCKDITFKLGSPVKRWNEIHLGDSVSADDDFAISIGESSDPDSELYRLQLNGEDIALRSDFRRYTTRDLNLYNAVDENGDPLPVPRLYQDFTQDAERSLPPETSLGTQDGFNEWVYSSLQTIVGYEPGYIPASGPWTPRLSEIWNPTDFKDPLVASKGVVTPIQGNVTDYENAGLPSQYFHKADGSVSDRVPLNQSYWVDVPRLRN